MKARNGFATLLGSLVLFAFLPDPAAAYIGPGAGLGALAVLAALVLGVVLLAVGLVWYPVKRMLKKAKGSPDTISDEDNPK